MHQEDQETRIVPMEHIRTAMQKAGASYASARPSEPVAPLKPARGTVWDTLPLIEPEAAILEQHRIVAVDKHNPASSAFDILRTRILQKLRQNDWTSVAITSPTAGGGKSSVALNLAFSLSSRQDCRTAVVDFDLRCPSIASTLGAYGSSPIEDFIRGSRSVHQAFRRVRENLAVAVNSRPVHFPAELLQGPDTARCVRDIKQQLAPDVILYDLPPMLVADDVMAFLPNVDCAILVVEAEKNTPEQVEGCEYELISKTNFLGAILNKSRHAPHTSAYGYGG